MGKKVQRYRDIFRAKKYFEHPLFKSLSSYIAKRHRERGRNAKKTQAVGHHPAEATRSSQIGGAIKLDITKRIQDDGPSISNLTPDKNLEVDEAQEYISIATPSQQQIIQGQADDAAQITKISAEVTPGSF